MPAPPISPLSLYLSLLSLSIPPPLSLQNLQQKKTPKRGIHPCASSPVAPFALSLLFSTSLLFFFWVSTMLLVYTMELEW